MKSATAWAFFGTIAFAGSALVTPASAHKTVVSPYSYYRDVAPILRDRCGSCHVEGGNAVPLTTYAQVKEQWLPLQRELLSGRMPIWYGEPQASPFRGSKELPAKELNVLLTWAAGGTPEGVPVGEESRPAPVSFGKPFVVLEMPKPFTLTPKQREAVQEIEWPAGRLAGKWVQAAEVMTGAPSIVRRATIEIKSGTSRQVVTHWIPGDTPQALPGGGAFRVPRGASIVLRIYYHQPFGDRQTVTDRSRIAIHVLDSAKAKSVNEIRLTGGGEWRFNETAVFTRPVDSRAQIIAIHPVSGAVDGRAALTLIGPDGRRTPLATLVLRPEWPRRYVFDTPIAVAAGSRIEAVVTSSYGISWNSLTGDRGVGLTDGGPLQILFETLR